MYIGVFGEYVCSASAYLEKTHTYSTTRLSRNPFRVSGENTNTPKGFLRAGYRYYSYIHKGYLRILPLYRKASSVLVE